MVNMLDAQTQITLSKLVAQSEPKLYNAKPGEDTGNTIAHAPVILILSAIVPALLVKKARSAVRTVAVLEVNTVRIFAQDCTVAAPLVAYDLKDIQAALSVVVLVFTTCIDLVVSDATRSVEDELFVIFKVANDQKPVPFIIESTVSSRFIKGI